MLLMLLALTCGITAGAVTADGITAQAIERFGKAPSVTATFAVTAGGHTAKGTITVSGDRFRMDVDGVQTWYDGRTQWTYSPSTDEVNITEPTADELSQINPFAIVSSLRDNYSARLLKSASEGNTVVYTPKRQGDGSKLTVTYNPATSWPSEVKVDNGTDTVTITVKTVSTGKTQHPSVFVYDKKLHPGAEIVDLR